MNYMLVDLGFGDSGKGAVTHYLLKQGEGAALVIRYCGGYQAAHHVVKDGVRKRYSQIGSGTFEVDRPVTTYLGPNFICSPEHLTKELLRNGNGTTTRVVIDPCCLIATNFQREINKKRLSPDVASCAAGIAECRSYWLRYGQDAIFGQDLLDQTVLQAKLELMRQRYILDGYKEFASLPLMRGLDLTEFSKQSFWRVYRPTAEAYADIIFEGSQGVLLDENYGVGAPDHATWSTTTLLHAYQIAEQLGITSSRRIGILRAYSTRHGSGPFEEDASLTERLAPLEIDNGNDGPQGRFKFGRLKANLISYALNVPCCEVDEIALTCLDQLTTEEATASLTLVSKFRPVKIQGWGPEAKDKI